MSIIALMGPPGTGKSTMVLSAPKSPKHIIDVDRKVRVNPRYVEAIKAGTVTYYELGDTIQEDGMARRLKSLVDNKKGDKPPRGWTNFANYCERADSDPDFKNAGTVVLDSYTQLAPHMRAHIQWETGKGKFVWDAWSVWKAMWQETTTILIDYCISTATDGCKLKAKQMECEHGCPDKDLIIILHERVSEKPGEKTEKVRVTQTSMEGGKSREYQGMMDVFICGSIDGAFGLEFGTYFSDVYALRVDIVDGEPEWVCRVHPDGKRDLRCSFPLAKDAEYEPDFNRIMKGQSLKQARASAAAIAATANKESAK